jgi:hypothetical protein
MVLLGLTILVNREERLELWKSSIFALLFMVSTYPPGLNHRARTRSVEWMDLPRTPRSGFRSQGTDGSSCTKDIYTPPDYRFRDPRRASHTMVMPC